MRDVRRRAMLAPLTPQVSFKPPCRSSSRRGFFFCPWWSVLRPARPLCFRRRLAIAGLRRRGGSPYVSAVSPDQSAAAERWRAAPPAPDATDRARHQSQRGLRALAVAAGAFPGPGAGLSPNEVVVDCAARRKILRKVAPLAAGARDIHDPIHDRAQVCSPLAAAWFRGRNEGFNMPLTRHLSGRSGISGDHDCTSLGSHPSTSAVSPSNSDHLP